jgi:hypothetical protein
MTNKPRSDASDPKKPQAPAPDSDSASLLRMIVGRDVLALSVLAAVGVAVVAMLVYASSQEAVSVVGLFTTLVGTLAGTVFGVQVGHVSGERAAAAVQEQAKATAITSLYVPEGQATEVADRLYGDPSANGSPQDGNP